MSQQQDKGQDGARREASSVPRSPRPADTGMSPRNRRRKPHFGGAQLQIQTLESAATAAEGDAQDTARASDLPPQSPRTGGSQHPPKSPRSKPYRARGSRGRGGRRRRAAQKQAEAEAAAAALLGLPSSESPRSMTSANDEDSLSLYSDAADAASCLSSPMASPLHVHVGRPSSRHIQHEAEAQETQESALQRQRQHQATMPWPPAPPGLPARGRPPLTGRWKPSKSSQIACVPSVTILPPTMYTIPLMLRRFLLRDCSGSDHFHRSSPSHRPSILLEVEPEPTHPFTRNLTLLDMRPAIKPFHQQPLGHQN